MTVPPPPGVDAAFTITAAEAMLLLDWKRRVGDLYHLVRAAADSAAAWRAWRSGRDDLYAAHERSPLPAGSGPLSYYDYDPAARVLATVEEAEPRHHLMTMSGGSTLDATRFATASFDLFGEPCRVELFWLGEFRGGVFLPFRDATSGLETYGGGRYLLDSLKGEDLGVEGGRLVLDFNFAYHPPCFYKPEWSCPLAPPANHLAFPVRAGERIS